MEIKHTDGEIMVFLESAAKVANCEDEHCVYKDGCDGCLEYICKEALDLINRRNSEIERLKHILNCYALQYGTVTEHDVVEVVRCKDCEYCEVLDMDYGGKQYWCKFWSTPKREYADAYCCHGERKDQSNG